MLDIDECMESNDCMHKCSNYPGGRNCSCFEGFKVDSKDYTGCIPITPCNVSAVSCDQVCYEVRGRPQCSCHKGFSLNKDRKSCDDIDECITHRHKCSQTCNNIEASYTCSCQPGYKLASDEVTCDDVDECSLVDAMHCTGPLELCINTLGAFQCECQEGYQRVNNTCQETLHTTVEPSATKASSVPVKTTGMSLTEINNAVMLMIQDTDLSEWRSGLDEHFEKTVIQITVQHCQLKRNVDCIKINVNKRFFSWNNLPVSVRIIKGFPKKHENDIIVAFYVIFYPDFEERTVMPRDTLLSALKQAEARLSSGISKRISNIWAYQENVVGPTPSESPDATSRIQWIIIGVSLAVIVIMITIIAVIVSRHRRNSRLCELEKQRKRTDFVLRQWGEIQETVFLD